MKLVYDDKRAWPATSTDNDQEGKSVQRKLGLTGFQFLARRLTSPQGRNNKRLPKEERKVTSPGEASADLKSKLSNRMKVTSKLGLGPKAEAAVDKMATTLRRLSVGSEPKAGPEAQQA